MMSWKIFSSPSLAAMEKEKNLAFYWKPCLSDPFTSSGLLPNLPVEQTELMAGPQAEDIVDTKWYCYFFSFSYLINIISVSKNREYLPFYTAVSIKK